MSGRDLVENPKCPVDLALRRQANEKESAQWANGDSTCGGLLFFFYRSFHWLEENGTNRRALGEETP